MTKSSNPKGKKPKRGRKPDVLKLSGNWEDAIGKVLKVKPAQKKGQKR
jgi:hypothetical protein